MVTRQGTLAPLEKGKVNISYVPSLDEESYTQEGERKLEAG